jgi:hypothetical protein
MAKKNPSAAAPGREKKGGPARSAKLAANGQTPLQTETFLPANDTSDEALAELLNRLKTTSDPVEVRRISDQLERIVFHKQFTSA